MREGSPARLTSWLGAIAAAAVVSGCGGGEERVGGAAIDPEELVAEGGGDFRGFAAKLAPMNGSRVRGSARLALGGGHLVVEIHARGLRRNRVHGQAIHGYRQGRRSRCPSDAASRVALSGRQAARQLYGPALLRLEPFPTVRGGGEIDYTLTFTIDRPAIKPPTRRVLVISGTTVKRGADRLYAPDRPVACGAIRAVDG